MNNHLEQIRWQVFPRSQPTTVHQRELLGVFEEKFSIIGTPKNSLKSDEVLALLRLDLVSIGYEIEGTEKVNRPVLYGESDKPLKTYNVDGWHAATSTVLEIEAGQAVENNRFAIDILKALSIQDAEHLVIAVPTNYLPERLKIAAKSPKKEFDKVVNIVDSLFVAGRVKLPLSSILIIGY